MSRLPDPTAHLSGVERARYEEMATARSHADGRPQLGAVYVAMFNNPAVADKVGALGDLLRFDGVLPDAVRELVILRFAVLQGLGYEWSHHQRPARQAGLSDEVIEALTAGRTPDGLDEVSLAVLSAVDAVAAYRSIPEAAQATVVDAHGTAGVVELVALCGLYALMGYTVTAFDIPLEDGFPPAPF